MRDELERARERALRSLERKRRTRRELEDRLARAGFEAGVIQAALDRLAGVGLVDDLEYARAFLRERLAKRAVGERALRQSLAARGIGREVAEEALAELRAAEGPAGARSESERARRAARELSRKYERLEPRERRRRLLAALARRGFDFETASQAVEELGRA